MRMAKFLLWFILLKHILCCVHPFQLPVVVNTWGPPFFNASKKGKTFIYFVRHDHDDLLTKFSSVKPLFHYSHEPTRKLAASASIQ